MRMVLCRCHESGLECECCGENVNIHCCWKCEKPFNDDEEIICISHRETDSEHYHKSCRKFTPEAKK